MSKLDKRWSRFKQELPSIIFLSAIQIWWCFNWPIFIRLGAPWSTILAVSMSIIGVIVIIFLFSSMDTIARGFNKLAPANKKFIITTQIIVFSVGMLLLWYMDLFGISNIQYALFFAAYFLTFVLIYRAMYRVDSAGY